MNDRKQGKLWAATFALGALLLAPAVASALPLNAEQADRLRIQQHLAQVEQHLRRAPVDELAPAARLARARLLDELHEYWQAGVFPRNSAHPGERRPYFIDDEGRACAVGALVIRSGSGALAERIDRTFHTEYVPDMHDTELVAWAQANGFSLAELALIQPTYCNCDGWNGAFGPGGDGGAGGAPDGADYFQPVCASNGLTYWNECIAELCGGVTIVATGQCEGDAPCELCGTGTRQAVVSECSGEGVCNGIDSQPDLIPVNQDVGKRWLTLQDADCQDADYGNPGAWDTGNWYPAFPIEESWQCHGESAGGASGAGGTGGEPAIGGDAGGASAGGSTDDGSPATSQAGDGSDAMPAADAEPSRAESSDAKLSGGCTVAASPANTAAGVALSALVLGLANRRRKRRRH
jgi:hypothetical protein